MKLETSFFLAFHVPGWLGETLPMWHFIMKKTKEGLGSVKKTLIFKEQ